MPGTSLRTYKPALDGLRALAVIAVLCFHGEIGAPGGFLGVSVFFTLSGYLITRLLIAEQATTGTISLLPFYGRRLRRLMPAAFLCFALVLALGAWWTATQRRELPGDLLAALLDVSNWRFAFATTSYQDLFIGAPSPVAHFWSLSIEEQFYIALPILAWVALRRSRRTFALTAWVLLAASITATVLTTDRDVVYNGTHTRAAELLFGVILAMLPLRRRSAQRVLRVAAPVALAALIVLVLKASVTDSWLYDGGLVLVGLCSALVIGGIAHGGPLSRVLSQPTLVAIGRISYGLYLFHWPLFLLLSEERLGYGGVQLFIVRLAATFTAAFLSFSLLEQPIRSGRRLPVPRHAGVAAVATLLVLVAAALVVVPAPNFTETEALLEQGAAADVIALTPGGGDASGRLLSDEAAAALTADGAPHPARPTSTVDGTDSPASPEPDATAADGTDPPDTDPADTDPAGTDPEGTDPAGTDPEPTVSEPVAEATPPRLLVVGSDDGPLRVLEERGYDVVDGLQHGCPIATAVEVKLGDGTTVSTEECEPSWIHWARSIRNAPPDVVVVSTGPLDRAQTRGRGDDGYAAPGDLVAQSRRLDAEESDLRAAIAIATESRADVWIVDHRGDARKGVFDERVARVALTDQSVRGVVGSDTELVSSLDAALNAPVEVRTLRVVVIGDSVSLNFARSLADAIPGALDVVWAGENGCPFVRARATRVSADDEWETNRCRTFDEKLPPILDEFEPDVVVMMVSLRELADQLYWGDDAAHVVGDEAFTAYHDAEMAELVALLEPRGIPLLVTDTPPIVAGAMASQEMADPLRIAAWNAQIQRWADGFPLVDLLVYAAPLIAYEEQHGSIRADGVHPEIEPLTELARDVFVPAVIAQARAAPAGGETSNPE